MTVHSHADDFDIAKSIFDQLKELPAERQQRVLRWIAEGLGVSDTPRQAAAFAGPADLTPAHVDKPDEPPRSRATDIKSFVSEKSPKSDQQFAATVAYFYRFETSPAERRESVNGEILQEAARLAGRKRLANPRVTLNNAKSAGYLDGAAPGEFAINSVGENLVAMTLPGGTETPVPRRRTKVKRNVKTAKKRR